MCYFGTPEVFLEFVSKFFCSGIYHLFSKSGNIQNIEHKDAKKNITLRKQKI
jgi:hypothetical protein